MGKMKVYQDEKFGRKVWISLAAEKVRQTDHLCANGCKIFGNNLRWQEEVIRQLMENDGLLRDEAERLFYREKLMTAGQASYFKLMTGYGPRENEPCPIATAFFAVCASMGNAFPMAQCPFFIPDESRVEVVKKPADKPQAVENDNEKHEPKPKDQFIRKIMD